MDEKLAEIIHKQYLEFSKKFKPRFGIEDDLQITKAIQKTTEIQKQVDERDPGSRGYDQLVLELHRLEKNTLNLIKQQTNL